MAIFNDTIAALATPEGTSAIALVRVSGPDVQRLAGELFGGPVNPRVARHGDYRDRAGALVDDVVHTFFPAQSSYTGEDALEISSHGNPLIAQKILEDLFGRGCRAAHPGEFTQRAFLSGRMDLSQAEAVMDVIHARSEAALAAANRQLRGALGEKIGSLTERLFESLARIEAYIDFPDEDLPAEDRDVVRVALESLLEETNQLLATNRYGNLLREGIRTVLVGAPNAGKSSLLNRLVGHERALVSPEPGTTRDFIEERIMVGSYWFRLIDTAGLNPTPNLLEKRGMENTVTQLRDADVVLLVTDATAPLPDWSPEVRASLDRSAVIMVSNKIDLVEGKRDVEVMGSSAVLVSAATGQGLDHLLEAMVRRADDFRGSDPANVVAINARHADALGRAKGGLASAVVKMGVGGEIELIASDLRGTLNAYGEIVGRVDNERMLDHLFASFCIGK